MTANRKDGIALALVENKGGKPTATTERRGRHEH